MGRKPSAYSKASPTLEKPKKPKEGMGDGGHLGDAVLDRVLIVLVETFEEAGVHQADQVLHLAHSPSKVARTRVVGSQTAFQALVPASSALTSGVPSGHVSLAPGTCGAMTLAPSRPTGRTTFAVILILTILVLIQVGGIMERIGIRQVLSPDRLQQQPKVSGVIGGERAGDQDAIEITETSLFKHSFFGGHGPLSPSASRTGGEFPAAESGQTQTSSTQSARGTRCFVSTESGEVLGNSTMGATDLLSRWTDLAVIQDIIRSAASLPRGHTPRIFHFVWVSPRLGSPHECLVPASVVRSLGMWHEKHPSWDIILWTDPTVRAHFPQLSNSLLSNISIPAWISDIVRFATLEQVGGVYFDTDTLPLLNIQVRNLMP